MPNAGYEPLGAVPAEAAAALLAVHHDREDAELLWNTWLRDLKGRPRDVWRRKGGPTRVLKVLDAMKEQQ